MWRSLAKYVPTAVGLLFLYSGVYKILRPAEATAALMAVGLMPAFATVTIVTVTVLELYAGVLLVTRFDLQLGLHLSVWLLFIFASFLFYLSTMAHPPSCGCMGLTQMFTSNRHNALLGLFRNCVLLWLLKSSHGYYFKGAAVATSNPG